MPEALVKSWEAFPGTVVGIKFYHKSDITIAEMEQSKR